MQDFPKIGNNVYILEHVLLFIITIQALALIVYPKINPLKNISQSVKFRHLVRFATQSPTKSLFFSALNDKKSENIGLEIKLHEKREKDVLYFPLLKNYQKI